MAKAVYCDHCDNLFREDQVVSGTMSGFNLFGSGEEEFDLCKECRNQLKEWVFSKLNVESEGDDANYTKEENGNNRD